MPAPLHVLLAEDSLDDAELLLLELSRNGFEVVWKRVDTAGDMRAALAEGCWEIILSDYSMPGLSAPEALILCRECDPDLPFIVISGTIGEVQAVEMMRAGANDYFLKDSLARLPAVIERELREVGNRRLQRRTAQSASLLAAIVESSDDAIICTDLNGVVQSWNGAAERLFGYSAAEAIGRADFLIPPDHIAGVRDRDHRIGRGEYVPPFETERLRKGGQPVAVSVTLSPVRVGGRIAAKSAIYRDITERKRAEQENLMLRSIIEYSPNFIAVSGPNDEVVFVNRAGQALLGLTRDEAEGGTSVADYHPADELERLERDIIPVLRTGGFVNGEVAFRHFRTGARIPTDWSVFAIPSPKGDSPVLFACVANDVTDRIRREQELRESEARFRQQSEILKSTLDNMSDGVVVVNEKGEFILFNPAAEKILNLGKTDAPPDEWPERYSLYLPDGNTPFPAAELPLVKALAGESSDDVEMILNHTRVPNQRWISVNARPMRDDAGRISGGIAVFRNVTERKLGEQAVQASEERFRAFMDHSPATSDIKDEQGRFLYVNLAWLHQFDHEPTDWRGKTNYDFWPRETADLFRSSDELCLAQNAGIQMEETAFTSTGEERTWIVMKFPLEEGGKRRIGSMAWEISDKKRAEKAVSDTKKRLQHVLSSSPSVLFTLSIMDNKIIRIEWISDNIQEMLGYSTEEALIPGWWLENVHSDDREEVTALVRAELFGTGRSIHEYRFRHRNGQYRWTRAEIQLIFDEMGKAFEAVGAWSDITDRKRLEAQFHQAQKMDAFGQLAGGVAHDFNNLLTVINGYSDIILHSLPKSDHIWNLVSEIHKAGERSAGLTRQLLAFSRQQVLAPRIVNLNEIVAETDKMLRRLIGEDVRLTTTLDSDLQAVRADPGQLEQVLLNLAVNARDAMPKGGRLIIETQNVELDQTYVLTHSDSRIGPHVLLSVTDTGTGISPEVIAKIFEPFFTTKEPGKGTGLGLATVYGIVSQSGGHVAVESELGVGTTFKVYLPQVEYEFKDANSLPEPSTLPRGTETILLVEDEAGVRNLTGYILEDCGYTVLGAGDGSEAVRVSASHDGPIHLLVTDVVMPGIGGRLVAEELAKSFPEMRVLFVSGYTDDAVIRNGVLRDGVPFLQKPFSPFSLAKMVREVLDESKDSKNHPQ